MVKEKIDEYRKNKVLLYIVTILYSCSMVLPTILSSKLLNVFLYTTEGKTSSRNDLLLLTAISIVLFGVFGLLYIYFKRDYSKKIRTCLENAVFINSLRFDKTEAESIRCFSSDINIMIEKGVENTSYLLVSLIPCAISLLFSMTVSAKAFFLILVIFVLLTILNQFMLKPYSSYLNDLAEEKENLLKSVKEYLGATLTLNSYNADEFVRGKIEKLLISKKISEERILKYKLKVEATNNFFSVLIQIIPLVILVIMSAMGRLKIGDALGVMLLLEKIVSPIDELGVLMEEKKWAEEARNRLDIFFADDERTIEHKKNCTNSSEIVIEDLSFSYGDMEIIRDFSFTFEAGNKYLIMGKNGCGKTTLFKILTKQITDYKGDIYIKGRNLRDYEREELFSILGMVSQDDEIIDGTVMTNVFMGKEEDVCVAEYAFERLGLKHDLLSMEEAQKVSGGEKRRIMMARLVAHPKEIVLLDEVLCGIDRDNANRIEEFLLRKTDSMIIHISHRTSEENLGMYDKVINM